MSRLKRVSCRVPGVIVAHGLWKNFRHVVQPGLATHGGIARAALDPRRAAGYVTSIFQKVDGFLRAHGGWTGKRVLEIGPGDSLGTGLLALAHGARSYHAIDAFRVRFDPAVEAEVFALLRATLGSEESARVRNLEPAAVPSPGNGDRRLHYVNDLPLERAPDRLGAGAFDVIYSNAVLEHVADPPEAAQSLATLLAPGGVMFHDIDLRSHQTFEAHPLQFLEHPEWLWHMMSSRCGQPNRARRDDWLAHFRAVGLEILAATVTKAYDDAEVERVRPRLARSFRDLPAAALVPAVVIITCRKS